MSNFDCYYVSRLHKAPRPFVFAVKSTDNLTLFENPADYLHVFSCEQKFGQQWMERILLARVGAVFCFQLRLIFNVLFSSRMSYTKNVLFFSVVRPILRLLLPRAPLRAWMLTNPVFHARSRHLSTSMHFRPPRDHQASSNRAHC